MADPKPTNFAKGTTVPIERTRAELERLLPCLDETVKHGPMLLLGNTAS